jgi:molybdenum cofactor cytidylyltransferase
MLADVMPADATHAVVVLAAGASRRLGEPKQQLRRDGETLLARTLRIAAESLPRRLRVVVATGQRWAGEIATDHIERIEVAPGQPLSISLSAGLADLDDVGHVLLLPVDLPLLEAAHLQHLLTLARHSPSRIAATRHGRRPGIPAVLAAPFEQWREGLAGDRGLQARLAALPADALGWLDEPALGRDIDDAEQLRAARSAGWIDLPSSGRQG